MQIGKIFRECQHHRVHAQPVSFYQLLDNIVCAANHVHTAARGRQHVGGKGVERSTARSEITQPIFGGNLIFFCDYCGLQAHHIRYLQDDACRYRHPGKPHVVIAETMQKSLEQEPQFAVTANLAPQLHAKGIFIPQKVEVSLCPAKLEDEMAALKRGDAQNANLVVGVSEGFLPPATHIPTLTWLDDSHHEAQQTRYLFSNPRIPAVA